MPSSLQTLLGIRLPLIQAPMAGSQGAALAAAVSNAGGLGSLPCAMHTPESLARELAAFRSATAGPVNLNFFCHEPPAVDEAALQAWRELFAGYYAEWGVDPAALPAGPARQPFNADMAALLLELRPEVVSFHFGLPPEALLSVVRQSGARILSTATTVAEAVHLEQRGVDAVIAQGAEAGGHRGMFLNDDIHSQIGTFALLPRIADAVSVPVIAAGGIASPQGVKAAMLLGAAAVQVGTAYLLCPEAGTSAVHRAALKSPAAGQTVLTNVFSGRPARGMVNRLVRELGPMNPAALSFPLATAASAVLRSKAEAKGCADFSPLWAGQNVGGCREIPAAELTAWLVSLL